MKKTIYSELDNLTEKEFFKRELGVNLVFNSTPNKLRNVETLIIASNNPSYWREFLITRRKNSVIFFLVGNETYEPKIFHALNGLFSLRHVFVYNPPQRIKFLTGVKTFIGNLVDHSNANSPFSGNPIRELLTSLHLIKKFDGISMDYKFSSLPQGYSNNFAGKFAEYFKLNPNQSLIEKKEMYQIKNISERNRLIGFSGQPTNLRRFKMIQSSLKYMDEPPEMTEGFRGAKVSGNFNYLNQLLNCKLILVPPGFFNNSNHRYTESLICGALPVILAKNSLDPSENSNWTNCIKFLTPFSSKLLLRYLSKLSDAKLNEYFQFAQNHNFEEILHFRNVFTDLITSS